MREILFRGKRVDNGEWVYGYNIFNKYITIDMGTHSLEQKKPFIIGRNLSTYVFKVIPETVGQYTGLNDKNGKKMFEGDKLYRNHDLYGEETGTVIFKDGVYEIVYKNVFTPVNHTCIDEWEVIGTIFDKEEGDLNEIKEI